MPFILALDQGTTSTRSIVFDERGQKLGMSQIALEQQFPQPGWVEHDATLIWRDQLATARAALEEAGRLGSRALGHRRHQPARECCACGTAPPECRCTTPSSGRTAAPPTPARSSPRSPASMRMVRERTGLSVDPYFSASKIAWLLDNVEGARRAGACRGAGGGHHRHLADPQPHRRRRACHRCHQRVADAPLRHPRRSLGPGTVRAVRRAAWRCSPGSYARRASSG